MVLAGLRVLALHRYHLDLLDLRHLAVPADLYRLLDPVLHLDRHYRQALVVQLAPERRQRLLSY